MFPRPTHYVLGNLSACGRSFPFDVRVGRHWYTAGGMCDSPRTTKKQEVTCKNCLRSLKRS